MFCKNKNIGLDSKLLACVTAFFVVELNCGLDSFLSNSQVIPFVE